MTYLAPPEPLAEKGYREIQLTDDETGHCLHHLQVFSPDDQWIVYDTRNHDAAIASTGSIRMVNVETREIRTLYDAPGQSAYGPGVGAATFSPQEDKVLFIHGIRDCSKEKPYGFARRTGVAVDIKDPYMPIFMDARNIVPPFTAGALRGGTHAHSWSSDAQRICFTYNDYIMEQLSKTDPAVRDLRTVGVMTTAHGVKVPETGSPENHSGEMFSVVVAKVTEHPAWGSDETDRAFDECWIGKAGYRKPDGSWQRWALAFQGHVRDASGTTKTELFVADLPEDLTVRGRDGALEGTPLTRPGIPQGVVQRRITRIPGGIKGPRHWLRATGDGRLIAFLSEDAGGIVQVFGISPNGGEIRQLTFSPWPVQGQFNFSPDDRCLAYIAGDSVFITDMQTGKAQRLRSAFAGSEPTGGIVWSNKGEMLAYNRYVESAGGAFLQIFVIKLT